MTADGPVIVLLGRLHPAKGQLELLAAVPALLAAFPGARVALVGGEDPAQAAYADRVRRQVAELGAGASVQLTGHRDDAVELLAGADVVVIPSVPDERGMGREGFGLVGVEALAVGTPIVGYADGALPEVLGDAAVLVPPGDRTALAAAVVALLGDRRAARQLVARAPRALRRGLPRRADGRAVRGAVPGGCGSEHHGTRGQHRGKRGDDVRAERVVDQALEATKAAATAIRRPALGAWTVARHSSRVSRPTHSSASSPRAPSSTQMVSTRSCG